MLRIHLNAPPGNLLDEMMVLDLLESLEGIESQSHLRAILLTGEGEDFCFGVDVSQHSAERVPRLLERYLSLVFRLFCIDIPTMAVVHGDCFGAGLDLVSCCSYVFAAPMARFGQSEIKLGLFPAAGSALLPWRLGGARALDLCVSGRTIGTDEALHMGLIHDVTADPDKAAQDFFRQTLAPRSPRSLRLAERAVRAGFTPTLKRRFEEIQTLYLAELMSGPDSLEGVEAFLKKRSPRM